MRTVELEEALKTIGTVLDRNLQYLSFDLARGMFSSIQEALVKASTEGADNGIDGDSTATKQ